MNIIKDEEWGPVTYRGEGEDSRRYYTTPEGNQYPSVTTMLGFFEDPTSLDAWRASVGEEEAKRISERACERGEIVHAALERYVTNDPGFDPQSTGQWFGMFNQIRRAVDRSLDAVLYVEHALYSDALQVAGRVDLCGIWKGELAIIDFKNKNRFVRREYIHEYFQQACIYAIMHRERYGVLPSKLVILAAVEEGSNYNCQVFEENTVDIIPEVLAMFERFKALGGFEGPGIDWVEERKRLAVEEESKKATKSVKKKPVSKEQKALPPPPIKTPATKPTTTNLFSF
jgi:genome maintenance exonuclease 1